jgi:putative SOS response-associated peptidase YedK
MIITEPNEFVAEVHDRMPVLLGEMDFEPWLSGKTGVEVLTGRKRSVAAMACVEAGE